MNFYTIVSEFNPFHTGHRYLIEKTKEETDANAIVCIMSGSMVQRGDVAIYDKWTRAKAAVENGADLVIELPVCYVLQSADIFALGAVKLADKIGTYGIAFGSECTDMELLKKIAMIKHSESDEFSKLLKSLMDNGLGYPSAFESALRQTLGDIPKEAFAPNATLATSYMASVLSVNPAIKIHAQKRLGDYHSVNAEYGFASATALRQKIMSGDKTSPFLLCTSDDIYDISNLSGYILGFLRTCDENRLKHISGMEDGLFKRLKKMSFESTSFEELVSKCATKRYTEHRIRRVILCSVLNIESAPEPQYVRVLALNTKGAEILKSAKKKIEIVTKVTNSSQNESLKKDILSTDIASICAGKKAGMDYYKSPVIID